MTKLALSIASAAIMLMLAPFLASAAVSDNVSGFAWSENIGWVSFNSENDHNPDTPGVQPAAVSYGLNVRNDNFLEGYAWSEHIGWISFNLADTGAPPAQYDYSGQGFIAKLQNNGELRGWARALAGMDEPNDGWDGWIKLHKHPSDGGPDYGVLYNDPTSEFENWAWGSDVVGWLSFNCNNDHGSGPVCDTSAYQVTADVNSPPRASQLSVSANYADSNNICLSPPDHTFSWTFSDNEDGGNQTSYDLEVDNNNDFASPEVDVSGGSAATKSVAVVVNPVSNQLSYNQTYYWRVKVYDSGGLDSGWIYPPSPPGNPDVTGPGDSFTTAPHLYPISDFNFVPAQPSQGEEITFTENSTCYDINNNPISCPAADANYKWDFDYEDGPPFTQDAIGQEVTHTYNDTNRHTAALDVTDTDGKTCRGTSEISPKSQLPRFREVPPSSFFEKIMNALLASLKNVLKLWI